MVHLWIEKCSDSLEHFIFPTVKRLKGKKHIIVSYQNILHSFSTVRLYSLQIKDNYFHDFTISSVDQNGGKLSDNRFSSHLEHLNI